MLTNAAGNREAGHRAGAREFAAWARAEGLGERRETTSAAAKPATTVAAPEVANQVRSVEWVGEVWLKLGASKKED